MISLQNECQECEWFITVNVNVTVNVIHVLRPVCMPAYEFIQYRLAADMPLSLQAMFQYWIPLSSKSIVLLLSSTISSFMTPQNRLDVVR